MQIEALLDWSKIQYSELPWRKNRSLYRTLVSEIMLQQTTVGTVKNHYERFLVRFPDIESLAEATEDEITVAWKGLGYYRRARNLKKIAESIVKEHAGEFPSDLDSLQEIPGIGPYTASAIVGIGMDQRALALDANLERVIARLFSLSSEKGLKLQKEIQILFQSNKIFNHKISYRALNEALMDLGRTICQARKVSCELCPLRNDCMSFQSGKPLTYPVTSHDKKKTQEHELHLVRIYIIKKGKLLVYKKDEDEWLSGQYEVPTFVLKSTDKKLKQYPELENFSEVPLAEFKSGITKYNITNFIHAMDEMAFELFNFKREVVWKEVSREDSNLTNTTLKGLKHL